MLGWWIIVSTHTPEERDRADQDTKRSGVLAQWEAGVEGVFWIEDLVGSGRAKKLSRSGYPNRYTVRASDVLPLLYATPTPSGETKVAGIDGPLGVVWGGMNEFHAERADRCPADLMLTVDAWDQS